MKTILLVAMWLPMIVLGHVLGALWFKEGTLASYAFFIAWPIANIALAYRLCQTDGHILVVRLVTFLLVELATLAIVLLYFG
ncbi:hypothetical protein IM816_15710 [Luteibacter flocculans]|uniref:Uncharacterized protein n=1 Tax=Luteibacter flocculans TaxID=2780091 RepID=A0ABY4T1T5_9GAMM|nr:hypothetical protein [Luteibacter flocculans]URL58032.1 hypothetical protein IM816_15710 [Luteibacter flocculans]